jgi:hypothetical protein
LPVEGRKPLVGILGVDARFERMAADRSCSWRSGSGSPAGHAQLPFDQILAGDHLGHRVLDLQAGVHLHEVEAAVLVALAMNSTVPAPT